jgi:colanic acid/amylovoran biosynthesis glycosyltransferase
MYVKLVFGLGLSITIHGSDEFYDTRGQLLREKVETADFICCISHFARSQLLREGTFAHWHKLEVCRLGVDTEAMRGVMRQTPSDARFEILCVGRLTPSKAQYILVSAIQELRSRYRNIHLRIVGDGEDRETLGMHVARLGLEDHVAFEGPIGHDRIRDYYATSDLFVLASFAEGLPVVLMEAMAMGVPVVSTTVAGIPELIRHERDGLLVAPSDVEGLAAAIAKLIDDPDLRARLSASARRVVETRYNLQANVAQLEQVFRSRIRVE